MSSDVLMGDASQPGRNVMGANQTAKMGAMRPLRHVEPTARRWKGGLTGGRHAGGLLAAVADEGVGRMWEVFSDVVCSETGERMKEVLVDGREEGGDRGREKGEVKMMEKSRDENLASLVLAKRKFLSRS